MAIDHCVCVRKVAEGKRGATALMTCRKTLRVYTLTPQGQLAYSDLPLKDLQGPAPLRPTEKPLGDVPCKDFSGCMLRGVMGVGGGFFLHVLRQRDTYILELDRDTQTRVCAWVRSRKAIAGADPREGAAFPSPYSLDTTFRVKTGDRTGSVFVEIYEKMRTNEQVFYRASDRGYLVFPFRLREVYERYNSIVHPRVLEEVVRPMANDRKRVLVLGHGEWVMDILSTLVYHGCGGVCFSTSTTRDVRECYQRFATATGAAILPHGMEVPADGLHVDVVVCSESYPVRLLTRNLEALRPKELLIHKEPHQLHESVAGMFAEAKPVFGWMLLTAA